TCRTVVEDVLSCQGIRNRRFLNRNRRGDPLLVKDGNNGLGQAEIGNSSQCPFAEKPELMISNSIWTSERTPEHSMCNVPCASTRLEVCAPKKSRCPRT